MVQTISEDSFFRGQAMARAFPPNSRNPRAELFGRFVAIVCAALVAAILAVPSFVSAAPDTPVDERSLTEAQRAAHALNRLAYGPRPGDIERVAAIGVDRWIDAQLNPRTIPLASDLESLTARGTYALTLAELYLAYGPTRANLQRDGPNDPDAIPKVLQRARVVVDSIERLRLQR